MNTDYFDLKTLQGMPGYQKLQALWAHQYSLVMIGLQKAAAKGGNESYWRYQAGILKGFDLAIGQLERSMAQMEKEGIADEEETRSGTDILKELRGEPK